MRNWKCGTPSGQWLMSASRCICCLMITFLCSVANAQSSPASTGPSANSKRQDVIDKFVDYYVELYSKQLSGDDWVARAMAVIGMSKIDDQRLTDKLVWMMDRDKSTIVQVAAWEALHARQDKLSAKDRALWEAAGFRLAQQNALRGDLRLGLLGLIEAHGPTPKNKEIIKQIFAHTNSMDGRDIRTLQKVGDILKKWQSPDIVKGIIDSMKDVDDAYRAELVLQRIDSSIPVSYKAGALPEGERGQGFYTSLYQEGTKVMMQVTQKRWMDWYDKQKLKEIAPTSQPYAGKSEIMPLAEKITDTRDPKWRKDLEMAKFRLGQLDMGIAIDSTASMGQVIRWIQRDVGKMMLTFEAISREPRLSVALYRDKGDKYVVQASRLTENAAKLAADLKTATAAGGGDIPEAVYEALDALVNKQTWSGPDAKKVIVLVGDAPPHKETMDSIEKLVKDAAGKGFTFHCIKVKTNHASLFKDKDDWDHNLDSFDKIAQWGNGSSFWVSFMDENYNINSGTAAPDNANTPERMIFTNMLKAVVTEDYFDRIEPFVTLLLNCSDEPLPEKRRVFPPVQKSKGGKSQPPKDPQDQH